LKNGDFRSWHQHWYEKFGYDEIRCGMCGDELPVPYMPPNDELCDDLWEVVKDKLKTKI